MAVSLLPRIQKAEAIVLRPAESVIQSALIAKPARDAHAQERADYEKAVADAEAAGHRIIFLTPLRPCLMPEPERTEP